MKKAWKSFLSILLVVMLSAIMVLAVGCTAVENTSSEENSGISGEKEESSQEEGSDISGEKEDPSREEESLPPSSAASQEDSGSETSSEESSESQTETPAKSFEEKFAENQLDPAYEEAGMYAVTSKDMADLAVLYAGYWEQEVDMAYDKLMELSDNEPSFIEEQNTWINGRKEAMQQIADQVAGIGGSMRSVESACLKMEYFRTRAMEIYKEIYTYDPDFTFQVNVVG